MKSKKYIWIAVFLLFVVGVIWLIRTPGKAGAYDEFAQCIADSGTKYYAAFWCPVCKNQEAMFGRSSQYMPKVECSTPDGRGQLQVCTDAEITAYPTWVFPDGTRQTGLLTLEVLAERTGCALEQ
jgi:large repetitive protein